MSQKITRPLAAGTEITLDAPTVPGAIETDGKWVLNVGDLTPGQKIKVEVGAPQKNWHPSPGDTLFGYLNDTQSENQVSIDLNNVNNPFFDTYFEPSIIPNGDYQAWYTKTNIVQDTVRSYPLPVTITGSTASNYPGPLFPEAENGVLTYTSISQWQGTPIQAKYGTIAQGDQVTFHWKGFDESGFEVPGAAYTTNPAKTVSKTDAQNGYVQDQIPFANIQALGDLGSGVAYYEVQPAQGKANTSLNTKVTYTDEDITALQLTVTKEAALQAGDLPHLRPFNTGTVFGAPGAWVTITVDGGAILEAGEDQTTYLTQLVEGFASFRVSSSDKGLITVTAVPKDLVGDPPVKSMPFGTYIDGGDTGIQGYNYTTNVPATTNMPPSDQVPCYVYFQVNPGLQSKGVTVTVDGHARILGADPGTPQTRTISLYDDGSGVAEIVDTVAEKVNVTLSVPGQQGSVTFPHPVEFIEFPSAS